MLNGNYCFIKVVLFYIKFKVYRFNLGNNLLINRKVYYLVVFFFISFIYLEKLFLERNFIKKIS